MCVQYLSYSKAQENFTISFLRSSIINLGKKYLDFFGSSEKLR